MPRKKKQKVDSEKCSKTCIINFSSSNEQNFVNLFQAADKDKKFETIKQIASKPLNQPGGSFYQLSKQCANIPTSLRNHHDYHSSCHQSFTKNLDTLEVAEQTYSSGVNRKSRTAANKWNDGVLLSKDRIYCNNSGVWTTEELSYFKFGGGDTIQEIGI